MVLKNTFIVDKMNFFVRRNAGFSYQTFVKSLGWLLQGLANGGEALIWFREFSKKTV